MVEKLLDNPQAMQDIGFFWVFVIVLVSASVYFAPVLKKWIEASIEGKKRIETAMQNSTAAINNSTAAVNNNTVVMREVKDERDATIAILREHDRASEIRFIEQNTTLGRMESKLDR